MVSGKQELLCPSFHKQAGRQALSTLFNQVSMKAERNPSAFQSRGFVSTSIPSDRYSGFRSKATRTSTGRTEVERKMALKSVENEKEIERLQI